jgi:lipoprotein-anchoring transpeptidase ErfK/SrfK
VTRIALALLFAVGFTCAGVVSAAVVTAGTTTTTTTTTSSTSTGTTTQPPPATIVPSGVTIGGVDVGGLEREPAYAAVRAAFERPLVLLVGRRRLQASPTRLGAVAYARNAVTRALAAAPGAKIQLKVAVRGARTRSYVAALAKRFDRRPVDARLSLRGLRPWVTKERPGRRLDRAGATARIVRALVRHKRGPLRLRLRHIAPAVTRASVGPVIVIRRGSNRLYVYRGMRFVRVFGVATGQAAYPTPLGSFTVAVKWRNPWWYPPNSSWAAGQKPIPPGPGNPLGTRWMGLSVPLVGIHGTPDAASIGYSASHGCIRMRIFEAEWLFEHVEIGTPVFIVGA